MEYAQKARERFPDKVLMVTGGFRSREGMDLALQSKACDLIGIARPAAVYPKLPKELLLEPKIDRAEAVVELAPVKIPWFVKATGIKPLVAGLITVFQSNSRSKRIVDANISQTHFQGEIRKRAAVNA